MQNSLLVIAESPMKAENEPCIKILEMGHCRKVVFTQSSTWLHLQDLDQRGFKWSLKLNNNDNNYLEKDVLISCMPPEPCD